MRIADISVELVDSMGTDLSVVNAARVSFAKTSDWEYYNGTVLFDHDRLEYLPTTEPDTWIEGFVDGGPHDGDRYHYRLKPSDSKLIKYLATHNHWTPFGHCFATFRVKAPIFVARQLVKHQVGLVWNEESRRYIDEEPEFYFPKEWRSRPDGSVKQGSGSNIVKHVHHVDHIAKEMWVSEIDNSAQLHAESCLKFYNELLESNVAPEQARMVLPLNTMTNWIWSGSLAAWARVCNLRLDPHTQKESQDVAKLIHNHCNMLWPVSMENLVRDPK